MSYICLFRDDQLDSTENTQFLSQGLQRVSTIVRRALKVSTNDCFMPFSVNSPAFEALLLRGI